jgi:hypothetical protein
MTHASVMLEVAEKVLLGKKLNAAGMIVTQAQNLPKETVDAAVKFIIENIGVMPDESTCTGHDSCPCKDC